MMEGSGECFLEHVSLASEKQYAIFEHCFVKPKNTKNSTRTSITISHFVRLREEKGLIRGI